MAVAGALVLLAMTSGCSGAGHDAATAAAQRFHRAFEAGQAGAALAPRTRKELSQSAGKPCEEAILSEQLAGVGDPQHVEVYGTMAQIRYEGETTFLARFQGGWKVMATGCSPRPNQPYDCVISGG